MVAAVLSPRTLRPSRKISPAPRKPIPDTTWAATRVGLVSPGTSASKITKLAEPNATKVLVRKPARRLRHCRSKPIRALSPPATARSIAACSMEIVMAGSPHHHLVRAVSHELKGETALTFLHYRIFEQRTDFRPGSSPGRAFCRECSNGLAPQPSKLRMQPRSDYG